MLHLEIIWRQSVSVVNVSPIINLQEHGTNFDYRYSWYSENSKEFVTGMSGLGGKSCDLHFVHISHFLETILRD